MNEHLQRETEGLIRSWMQHDDTMLRDYLVAEVEDPRINVQSILTRHFLLQGLFGDGFAALREQELRFGAVMNWALTFSKQTFPSEEFPCIHHALRHGADNAEGLEIPPFVTRTFAALPATAEGLTIPNYLEALLEPKSSAKRQHDHRDECLATFQRVWRKALASQPSARISVLEPACGSANDYRFLDAFGLARLLDYTGFDLCPKNIRNAQVMFPDARFAVGNVFEIGFPKNSFDYCFVHDLFEHLSIDAMGVAISELCRVVRTGIAAGYFNMHEGSEHVVRPMDDYHWNRLSLPRTKALFEREGFDVQAIHMDSFLRQCFGCDETHNKNAYTFLMRKSCVSG